VDLTLFTSTYILIALAEIGDKTQLLGIALASRYRAKTVLLGMAVSTSFLMLLAVAVGQLLYRFLPMNFVYLSSGIFFIFFGLLILKSGGEEKVKGLSIRLSPVIAVFLTFLLAELGDKTQLAVIPLAATSSSVFSIWSGATLGMVTVNGAGIFVGNKIKEIISESYVKKIAAALFFIFGVLFIYKSLFS
jgi:putative Ca2+/H+ antiporter (TMEM165/GDT1 family)